MKDLGCCKAAVDYFKIRKFVIMGKAIIDSSDKKSQIVKKILAGMGIDAENPKKHSTEDYREKLMEVSVWSEEDIKAMEDAGNSLDKFKPSEW